MNYNDGSWHGWNGGECPVHPETVVEFYAKGNQETHEFKAKEVCWNGLLGDIISFRVVKEHREAREFWITSRPNEFSEVRIEEPKNRHEFIQVVHVREVIDNG